MWKVRFVTQRHGKPTSAVRWTLCLTSRRWKTRASTKATKPCVSSGCCPPPQNLEVRKLAGSKQAFCKKNMNQLFCLQFFLQSHFELFEIFKWSKCLSLIFTDKRSKAKDTKMRKKVNTADILWLLHFYVYSGDICFAGYIVRGLLRLTQITLIALVQLFDKQLHVFISFPSNFSLNMILHLSLQSTVIKTEHDMEDYSDTQSSTDESMPEDRLSPQENIVDSTVNTEHTGEENLITLKFLVVWSQECSNRDQKKSTDFI